MLIAFHGNKDRNPVRCRIHPPKLKVSTLLPRISSITAIGDDTSESPRKCAIFNVPHASQRRLTALSDNDLPASANRDPTRDCPAIGI